MIEGRPRKGDLRLRRGPLTSLATETDVALETAWLQAGELVRRVERGPRRRCSDYDGRMLPVAHERRAAGKRHAESSSSTLRIDPALPDQLFTTQNLKLGRFPSY